MKAWKSLDLRKGAAEIGLITVVGVFIGTIGPFGSSAMPTGLRLGYWLLSIIGGGLLGVGIDSLLSRQVASQRYRVLAASVLATPLISVWAMVTNHMLLPNGSGVPLYAPLLTNDALLANGLEPASYTRLLWQIFVVVLPLMIVRALLQRRPTTVIKTVHTVETPLPEADATFRRRLSAKNRHARLIAVEAHDHYLRVHLDGNHELISMRFSDAMSELERTPGFRTHRSWWVAADAIQSVRLAHGGGEARLCNDAVVPVSRSRTQPLREAGWR